jgi:hypothetical protein
MRRSRGLQSAAVILGGLRSVTIQELQTARLQGKDAIIRFCAKYPRAFYETIQELESSDTLPEEMLASMARQINDAIAALQTSSMELLEL